MSGATIDYEALAKEYGGTTVKKGSASGTTSTASPKAPVDYNALAAQFGGTSNPAPASSQDFTSNPAGEGLYRMLPPSKTTTFEDSAGTHTVPYSPNEEPIPYSRVKDALAAGYKLHPDEEPRYQKDSAHPHQGPTLWEQTKSEFMSSTEPTPDVSVRAYDPNNPVMSSLNRAGDAMQNIYQMPWNSIKATDRSVYAGLPQLPTQAWDMVKKIYAGDPRGAEELHDFTPQGVLANLAEGYQRDRQQFGEATALANFGGNIFALYAVGKLGKKPVGAASKAIAHPVDTLNAIKEKAAGINPVRNAIEHFAETTPREIPKMAQKAEAQNVAKAEEHLPLSQEAAHKTQGLEVDYQRQLDEAEKQAQEEHRQKAKEAQEANTKIDQQIQDYRSLENSIASDTKQVFDADEAERQAAKDKENAAWKAWRDKVKTYAGSADPLVQAVEKWGVNTAEVKRLLAQAESEGDETTPPDPAYEDMRQQVIDQHVAKQAGTPYEALSPAHRALVDDMMKKLNIQPPKPPVNLQAGGTITLDELHRAKSVLRRHASEMRRKNMTVEAGEADQLANIFEGFEGRWSQAAGAFKEWMAAKMESTAYHDAFGREFSDPKTHLSELEQQTNPDFLKSAEAEELLNKIAARNPQLADAHLRIRAERDRLAKMDKPEALEKKRVEPPIPPEGGFRAHAERTVKQPERDLGPDRPKDVTISNEDITAKKTANLNRAQEILHTIGIRRALYATLSGVAFAVAYTFGRFGLDKGLEAAGAGIAAGPVVFQAVNKIVDLLDRPDVRAWVGKVTEKDAQAWSKLPPKQKALFTGDMQSLIKVADSKKVPVSPYLRAFVTSAAGGQFGNRQQQSIDQVKQKAQQLQSQPPPQTPAVQPPAPPGPESAIPLDNLKKIIAEAEKLRPTAVG